MGKRKSKDHLVPRGYVEKLRVMSEKSLLRYGELLEIGTKLFEESVPKGNWKEWVKRVQPDRKSRYVKAVGLYPEGDLQKLFGETRANGAVVLWLEERFQKEGENFVVKLYDEKLKLLKSQEPAEVEQEKAEEQKAAEEKAEERAEDRTEERPKKPLIKLY